jgi:hypothetical protein
VEKFTSPMVIFSPFYICVSKIPATTRTTLLTVYRLTANVQGHQPMFTLLHRNIPFLFKASQHSGDFLVAISISNDLRLQQMGITSSQNCTDTLLTSCPWPKRIKILTHLHAQKSRVAFPRSFGREAGGTRIRFFWRRGNYGRT